MKTILSTIAFSAILAFLPMSLSAQDTILNKSVAETTEEGTTEVVENIEDSLQVSPKRHIVKLNVPSLAVKTVSLQYEFFPMNWLSLNLGYKFTMKSSMPFEDKVIDMLSDATDDDLNDPITRFFEDFKFKGSAITPEVRFYLGKGYGKGFYLGPFLRFDNYKFNSTYHFRSFLGDYFIDFEGKYKGFGYGLNIGSQFTIGKHFVIDAALGPYFSNVKVNMNSTSNYIMTDEEKAELQEELNDFEIPNGDTEITVTNNSASGKFTADNFFNLRFTLGVGFRF